MLLGWDFSEFSEVSAESLSLAVVTGEALGSWFFFFFKFFFFLTEGQAWCKVWEPCGEWTQYSGVVISLCSFRSMDVNEPAEERKRKDKEEIVSWVAFWHALCYLNVLLCWVGTFK